MNVIGIDFGTLSARVVAVDAADGRELACVEHPYAHGVLDRALPDGTPLPPLWALQHPEDWQDVLREAVPAAVAAAGGEIVGIGIDTTASTPLPVRADGTPLCLLPELAGRPHAWPKLWKHHAAQDQADRINALAQERGEPWIERYGGRLSAEWQLAKALQVFEEDPQVYARTDRWIEMTDWLTWQLTGRENRSRCVAGYKGVFQDGRYPAPDYLEALAPGFSRHLARVEFPLSALGDRAGGLTAQAAEWTGLPEGIAVAVGNVDAHVAAAAADTLAPGVMLAVMGTSTCHVLNGTELREVPGACGVVDGGIVEGAYGYEAGQSGVGDIFAWWIDAAVPSRYTEEARAREIGVHELLTELAAEQRVGEHGLLALDWMNGNRSVLVDHELSGLLVGLTLATTAVDVYRALLEATAFGTRRIIEAFETSGVPVHELVVTGGLVRNPLLMQIYADVTGLPLSVVTAGQGPALGSAIHAAVAAGLHPDVPAAAAVMGGREHAVHLPDPEREKAYDELYADYEWLHDRFGGGGVMHRLRATRRAALEESA